MSFSAEYFKDVQPALEVLSQFGVIMLMLLSGLLTDYRTFKRNQKASIFIGTMGVIVTFFLVFIPLQFVIGPLYEMSTLVNVFIAAILSNTAIEICAGILLHSKRPKLRAVIIGASFIDDIIAVYLIGIVSTIVYSGEAPTLEEIMILSVKVIAFLAISLLVVSTLIERGFDKIMHGRGKVTLTVTLIMAFSFAMVASLLGLHEVIGAYIAGLIIGKWGERIGPMLKRRIAWEKLKEDIDTPLRAIFSPLFFGFIGISIILPPALSNNENGGEIALFAELPVALPLIIIILLLAVLGKIIGCGAAAKFMKFTNEESLTLGCAMCGRGALELVLLSFGRNAGLIDDRIFITMVMVTIITVFLTPILYSYTERRIREG